MSEDINKELCELLGIQWHEAVNDDFCSCGLDCWETTVEDHVKQSNPDFISNPVALLREMSKRSDWRLFWKKYMDIQSRVGWDCAYDPQWFVEVYLLDDIGKGKLAVAARDFLRREKKI